MPYVIRIILIFREYLFKYCFLDLDIGDPNDTDQQNCFKNTYICLISFIDLFLNFIDVQGKTCGISAGSWREGSYVCTVVN